MRLVIKILFALTIGWMVTLVVTTIVTGRRPTLLSGVAGAVLVGLAIVLLDFYAGW
jgi:uncharacterized membrane protein YGL010W